MTDRPILFSAPMVRALLSGQKTQTRRVMKVQPHEDTTVHVERFNQTIIDRHGNEDVGPQVFGAWWDDGESGLKCPYGGPGDRLWVRESHWWFKDEHDPETGYTPPALTLDDVEYRADGESTRHGWRPSIHMPRWASRITLEITGVRVERLNLITEVDALAEGCHPDDQIENGLIDPSTGRVEISYTDRAGSALESFVNLWERIHEVRPGDHGEVGWDDNPWVWVVEFKRA